MYAITIRFYEELNDFLSPSRKKRDIEFSYQGRRSVKDLIESFGVPHVEVDLILVNGESVDFEYIVADGDRISVYPVFESFSISEVTKLRPTPLREIRFVLDVHLRKLAKKLRLLGFDVDYAENRDDAELAEIAERNSRVLLTRDRQLLMRRKVERGVIVRTTDPEKQVTEILDRLQLWDTISPFVRCIECNGRIRGILSGTAEFDSIRMRIPPGVLSWCGEYYLCDDCGRIYWKGSHYDHLAGTVEGILHSRRNGNG